MLPVMQSLLQHLLSKEVLYPSLKEITEKVRRGLRGTVTPPPRPGTLVTTPWPPAQYPEWLRQQRAALPAAQYERYRAQLGVMARICRHLEAEGSEEGAGARTERFEAVLELMQQVGGPGGSPGAWGRRGGSLGAPWGHGDTAGTPWGHGDTLGTWGHRDVGTP